MENNVVDLLVTLSPFGFAPLIRALINYLKKAWEKHEEIAPLINVFCALIFGVIVSTAVAVMNDGDLKKSVAIGILSGFSAMIYNDTRERMEQTSVRVTKTRKYAPKVGSKVPNKE